MKREITFQITVGSKWVEDSKTPVGGTVEFKKIEFETDNEKPFDDAMDELRKQMGNEIFHVWYWSWHDMGNEN